MFTCSYFDHVKYPASEFNGRDSDFFGIGVLHPATDFALTIPATPNMSVNMSGTGTAWSNGYRMAFDANPAVNLSFATANPSNPRIDLIEIGPAGSGANGTAQFKVVAGTPAGSPIQPSADSGHVALYGVRVNAGVTSIIAANITDLRSPIMLINAIASVNCWRSLHSYSVGDICYSYNAASYKRFECVVAGITAATEPTWTGIGTLVVDGGVTWIVDDIRDGLMPGDIANPSMIVRPGRIKLNGALISRATYPRLFKYANDNNLISTEANWATTSWGLFGVGDGSTTFRVPDLRDEFIRGLDDGRGGDSGRTIGSKQGDAFKDHRHFIANNVTGSSGDGLSSSNYIQKSCGVNGTYEAYTLVGNPTEPTLGLTSLVSDSTITAAETRSRNIAYYYTMKY